MGKEQPKSCSYAKAYKAVYPPKCHCAACWEKYFLTHPGRFLATQRALAVQGKESVVSVLGHKYVKHFERFIQGGGREIIAQIAAI